MEVEYVIDLKAAPFEPKGLRWRWHWNVPDTINWVPGRAELYLHPDQTRSQDEAIKAFDDSVNSPIGQFSAKTLPAGTLVRERQEYIRELATHGSSVCGEYLTHLFCKRAKDALLAKGPEGRMMVLNANALDYLLAHQHLIPADWKNKDEKHRVRYITFWGTIYQDADRDLYVRCLYWDGRWRWRARRLARDWYGNFPAALYPI